MTDTKRVKTSRNMPKGIDAILFRYLIKPRSDMNPEIIQRLLKAGEDAIGRGTRPSLATDWLLESSKRRWFHDPLSVIVSPHRPRGPVGRLCAGINMADTPELGRSKTTEVY
ncbi:hypothetical protein CBL_10748 [Carabus blaptoides fortunei]